MNLVKTLLFFVVDNDSSIHPDNMKAQQKEYKTLQTQSKYLKSEERNIVLFCVTVKVTVFCMLILQKYTHPKQKL